MWAQVATRAGLDWDRDRLPLQRVHRAPVPPCWALCAWVEMFAISVVRKQRGYRVFFAFFLSVGHNSLRETLRLFTQPVPCCSEDYGGVLVLLISPVFSFVTLNSLTLCLLPLVQQSLLKAVGKTCVGFGCVPLE